MCEYNKPYNATLRQWMKSKDDYSHILKYTGLFGSIQLLSILIGLLKNKLAALMLGPAGFGLISLFNSIVNIVSNSTSLGLSMSAVRNMSEVHEKGDYSAVEYEIAQVRTWCLFTVALGVLACVVFSRVLNDLTFVAVDYTFQIACLSPVVGMLAVTGCELAVLKATRHLRKIALITVFNMTAALFISVPVYYIWGVDGIVPCIIVLALAQMLITVFYSFRLYPLKLLPDYRKMKGGLPMVRLGFAFVLTSILTCGTEFAIRAYINNVSSLDTVGLYSAGYTIVMVYGGMVFSAMETDYYPRLSAISDSRKFMETVNKQSEASLLLIAPMLTAIIVFAPMILPLLYSDKFAPVIPMIQIAVLALYIRAVKLPVSYISLAKGNSWLFFVVDAQNVLMIIIASIFAFDKGGLTGMGWAITAVGILDYFVILFLMWRVYGFKISGRVVKYLMSQYPLGCLALLSTVLFHGWDYWLYGLAVVLASLFISLYLLRGKICFSQS